MAENSKKRGGRYCAAGGPNLTSCTNTSYTKGISMHVFPKDETTRRKWTRFVHKHRPHFQPKSLSALCSAHFTASSFERNIDISLGDGQPEGSRLRRFLKEGAVPSVDAVAPEQTRSTPKSGCLVMQLMLSMPSCASFPVA